MLKQEKRRAAEAEAALARCPEGSPTSGAGALPLAGGRTADSGIQLDSSVRGSEGSTVVSPQDSRESSAVCHTRTHTRTHTLNAHDLPDPSSSRMVLAAVLRVRSEQL